MVLLPMRVKDSVKERMQRERKEGPLIREQLLIQLLIGALFFVGHPSPMTPHHRNGVGVNNNDKTTIGNSASR